MRSTFSMWMILAAYGLPSLAALAQEHSLTKADGYHGIWYANQPTKDEYAYKYSGGMATYPQQHIPIAIYSQQANKTFFVYGGADAKHKTLLHMVSYFDHATGTVPKPRILLDKHTTDAHDNPTLAIDGSGHLWIFSASHGTARPSQLHRSVRPYEIDDFEKVWETNFSYTQPWHVGESGFLFLHTRYAQGRGLFTMRSRDGRRWDDPQPLAKIEQGDYQISTCAGLRVATAFDFHPQRGGLNARTNLYYAETRDGGATWQTVAGATLKLPLTSKENPALVQDYQKTGQLVYLKDLRFDAEGLPVILYLLSQSYEPGPQNGMRQWMTARWNGASWNLRPAMTSDHNYDHGSLSIRTDGTWRVVAPTESGAHPWTTGGDMVLWESRDQGASWKSLKQLTFDRRFQHTYARRPVGAHPDFAALWADGDPVNPSDSRLYFTDEECSHVWRLPEIMKAEFQTPEVVW